LKHKILVADDDENIRLALEYTFEDHIVITVGDGQAAMCVIAAERPSVVLLDLNMPLMGGLEVLGALKDAKEKPLIIMLTGNDELEMVNKALEMGAASYITKPFEMSIIRKAVLSALAGMEDTERAGDKPWQVKKTEE